MKILGTWKFQLSFWSPGPYGSDFSGLLKGQKTRKAQGPDKVSLSCFKACADLLNDHISVALMFEVMKAFKHLVLDNLQSITGSSCFYRLKKCKKNVRKKTNLEKKTHCKLFNSLQKVIKFCSILIPRQNGA